MRLIGILLGIASVCRAAPYPPLTGAPDVKLRLDRLNVVGSVLMIAAHPDDENTALLSWFARGRKVRTAYLSATRGEGGQNLIGPEQGDLLGLIRTQELLAARRIDGAEQFFTRAIDFGFTKTVDETLAKWGRERLLEDMVRGIRTYRPDLIILRFSGTPRDGHGQHQTSAIIGKEAFAAAADPARFPAAGAPWQAKRLLFNIFAFTREQQTAAEKMPNRLQVDTGEFNALLGRSYMEIAGISRGQHRSQGMGSPERRGSFKDNLIVIAGEAAQTDVFEGIDLSWNRLPGGAAVGTILGEAASAYTPDAPEKTLPLLLKARPLIRAIEHPWAAAKLEELDEAIAACAGVWLDAASDRYLATPGSSVKVTLTALNRSTASLVWHSAEVAGEKTAGGPLAGNVPLARTIEWRIAADAAPSQPFWLERPKEGSSYSVEPPSLRNLADTPEPMATFVLTAGGEEIRLRRPVRYRYVDPVEGELTRRVVVAPAVAVNLTEPVFLFPNGAAQKITVQVKANVSNAEGDIRVETGAGWKVEPARQTFRVAAAAEQAEVSFTVTPPDGRARATLRAVATLAGRDIDTGIHTIAYSHFPPQTIFPKAEARIETLEVKMLSRKIGYVMGAGDDVPRSLRQLGCEVALLTADDLAHRDLREFDAIVTGVRAYNTRPDLRANQQRLFDYVRGGGTMVVQYNVPEGGPLFPRDTGELARLGPYPLKVGRGRVTVEEAPITALQPGHPLLNAPNRIGPDDWAGWVQERGLYFAGEWAPEYQTPIECNDPGEKPLPGGMLYARYGQGVYIFTGYSWFRQLPAGVPGAFRIFANVLSAGKVAP